MLMHALRKVIGVTIIAITILMRGKLAICTSIWLLCIVLWVPFVHLYHLMTRLIVGLFSIRIAIMATIIKPVSLAVILIWLAFKLLERVGCASVVSRVRGFTTINSSILSLPVTAIAALTSI